MLLRHINTFVSFRRNGTHPAVQRFRGGLVFKAHRICVSLNSTLERNKEEKETDPAVFPEEAIDVCGHPHAEGNDLRRVQGL